MTESDLITKDVINILAKEINENNHNKGFWDDKRSDGDAIVLMHSELSEAIEAAREGYPKDNKLPQHGNFEVELADCIIRILDLAAERNLDIGSAIVDKIAYNKTRPFKHGKKF